MFELRSLPALSRKTDQRSTHVKRQLAGSHPAGAASQHKEAQKRAEEGHGMASEAAIVIVSFQRFDITPPPLAVPRRSF